MGKVFSLHADDLGHSQAPDMVTWAPQGMVPKPNLNELFSCVYDLGVGFTYPKPSNWD